MTNYYSCLLRCRFRVAFQRASPGPVDRKHVSDPLSERSNLVFLPNFIGQQGSAVICSCHLLSFRQPLCTKPCYCSWLLLRSIISCLLRLIKYLTDYLITLLPVGAPVFYHVMIMVRLTLEYLRWRGTDSILGFDDYALTSCHRRRASLSPRAYPKILLRLF